VFLLLIGEVEEEPVYFYLFMFFGLKLTTLSFLLCFCLFLGSHLLLLVDAMRHSWHTARVAS